MALNFSAAQKQICLALLEGPRSLESVAERTRLKPTDIVSELKLLTQLKLVSLQGTPPVYALKEEVVQELKRRKGVEEEDDNLFRIRVMIEVQGIEETLVLKQVEKVLSNLKNEPFYTIYSVKTEKIEKVGEMYSTFSEINLSVRDFRGLVRLMFFYGPTSVEVIKPTKIEFTLDDFQDGLVDMAEMVHGYAEYIMGILNRKQVEEFHQKLYTGLVQAKALDGAKTPLSHEKGRLPEDLPTI